MRLLAAFVPSIAHLMRYAARGVGVIGCAIACSPGRAEIPPCHLDQLWAPSGVGAGLSISANGDVLTIGMPWYTSEGILRRGAVLVYRRSSVGWNLEATLTASDARREDRLGTRIAVEAETIIASTYSDEGDAIVYVFRQESGVWQQDSKLTGIAPQTWFGSALEVCGGQLLISAPLQNGPAGPYQGAVHVFERGEHDWHVQAVLRTNQGTAGSYFGAPLAVSGDTLAIGAPYERFDHSSSGSVYIFERTSGAWTQTAKIIPPFDGTPWLFGICIGLDGDTLIVGSTGPEAAKPAFSYRKQGTEWNVTSALWPSDRELAEGFGQSIAVDGDRAVVGARWQSAPGALQDGAVYVFELFGATYWTEQSKIVIENRDRYQEFGTAVAITNGVGVASAPGFSGNGGPVFAFSLDRGLPCAADIDRDGVVALSDLALLINNWTSPVPDAPFTLDLDADCAVGLGDLAAVLQNWAAECP